MKPSALNRNKSEPSTARHSGKCTVCKHPRVNEIESKYLAFVPLAKIGEEFDLTQQAILRHAQFTGLDEQRSGDTETVLKNIIGRGFQQVKKVDARLFMEAVKELNKIRGKHQAARQNDDDVARDERNKAWAEEKLREIQADFGVTREEAVEMARAHAPTVMKWIN